MVSPDHKMAPVRDYSFYIGNQCLYSHKMIPAKVFRTQDDDVISQSCSLTTQVAQNGKKRKKLKNMYCLLWLGPSNCYIGNRWNTKSLIFLKIMFHRNVLITDPLGKEQFQSKLGKATKNSQN